MLKPFFVTASLAFCLTGMAQSTVSGFVFNDSNSNGVFDKKETGLPNVSVSNGKDVVLTDARGMYTLPLSNDNIIFCIKPSGFAFKTNQYHLSQFYRIHKPAGSPKTYKYKTVDPTEPLPKALNFAMHKQAEAKDFSVLIFGDPQPYNEQELNYFAQSIVDDVKTSDAVIFGISLGDIVGDNLDLHVPYQNIMTKLALPWYNVMGNHDMNYEAKTDSLSDETFERNFGPNNYSWNYGNAHFIILDNILYPDPRDGKGYWGGLRPDQLEFIRNDLKHVAKNQLVVISFHIPFSNEGGDAIRMEDRRAFFDLLKDFEHCLLLSAHTHYQKQSYYKDADGWHGKNPLHEYNVGTTSGDWYSGELNANGIPDGTMRDGTPRGYAFLNISNNEYKIRYQVAGKDSSFQIGIYAPKIVKQNSRGASPFYANFFMGSEKNQLEYRIDDGKWSPMTFDPTFDYNYLNLITRWDHATTLLQGRRPSAPAATGHVWSAPVNKKLGPGQHTIHVRVTDEYGQIHHQSQSYMVQ